MEQIPTEVMEKIIIMTNGLWPLSLSSHIALNKQLNEFGQQCYRLASPCALCEWKEKEIAELKEQYGIMKGRTERAIQGLELSEKQLAELQEAYNKLIGSD